MEQYLLYTLVFIIGTLIGSFFTLALYRMPKGENILNKRSYCPKCGHQLGFFDLVPILSYLSLKGRCKYCSEKISPRYLIIEISSGVLFLLFAVSMKINIYNNELLQQQLMYLFFGIIYIAVLCLIAGIDIKEHVVQKGVLLFGLISQTIYIIYLYILGKNIYGYVIYILAIAVFLLIETIYLKKKGKITYPIEVLILCLYLVLWTKEDITILSIIAGIWLIVLTGTVTHPKREPDGKEVSLKVPIAAYICFSNIALIIGQNFIQ
ncbi:MAG: prepilin peptidase [Firmicutes bacterium]|nr:prepilin peptidase [Bacillota bacterium]